MAAGAVPGMHGRTLDANARVRFLPMTDGGEAERPCVEVGGVQVYVYLDEDRLVVSIDTETVEPVHLDEHGRFVCDVRLDGESVAIVNARAPR